MIAAITPAALWLGDRLAVGSIQALVLVAFAWLACRRRVRLSAAMQAALWWAVLLKVLLVLAPLPSLAIPILPAEAVGPPAVIPAPGVDVVPLPTPAADTVPADGGERWILLAVGIWLLGVGWHAAQMLVALRRTRAMVRRSSLSPDGDDSPSRLAVSIGLAAAPEIRIAEDVSAPLVVGVWRPTVLMPAIDALSPDERHMALGHEFMHVKRRDLAFAWIPAMAERLFFFHPLVRLAAREYITAREAACDAALIRALGVAPDDYGQLLVRFGITGQRLAWSAGGASGSGAVLRRRLDMLQHLSGHSRRAAWLVAAVIAIALVPSHLVARATHPSATPRIAIWADVELPPLLHRQAPAAALPQQRQAEPQSAPEPRPQPAPEPAPQPAPEAVRTADVLRDQVLALERQLRAAQAAAARAQGGQADQIRRESEKVQKRDFEQQLKQQAAQAEAVKAQAERINREYEQAQRLDAAKQQELAKQYQQLDAQYQQELARYRDRAELMRQALEEKANQSVPATRQDYLRQRLEELSQRLRELAELQQRLQTEAEQLKIELNAR